MARAMLDWGCAAILDSGLGDFIRHMRYVAAGQQADDERLARGATDLPAACSKKPAPAFARAGLSLPQTVCGATGAQCPPFFLLCDAALLISLSVYAIAIAESRKATWITVCAISTFSV